MARLTYLWLALFLATTISAVSLRRTFFVDPQANCGFDCNGNENAPFVSLQSLLTQLNSDKDDYYDVYFAPGVYKGLQNTALIFSGFTRINFRSSHGSSETIVDCEKNGRWLTSLQSTLTLEGFSVQNCTHHGLGGAILSINSTISIISSSLVNNHGAQGGALFAKNSRLSLSSSTIKQNSAEQLGGGVHMVDSSLSSTSTIIECNRVEQLNATQYSALVGDDIYCEGKSNGTSDLTSDLSGAGVFCSGNSLFNTVGKSFLQSSICAQNSTCVARRAITVTSTMNQTQFESQPDALDFCGDGVCDFSSESCLSCPSDCSSCFFDGLKLVTHACDPDSTPFSNIPSTCLAKSEAISSLRMDKIRSDVSPLTGRLSGYFLVSETKSYSFKLLGHEVGARLLINGAPVISSYFQQQDLETDGTIVLQSNVTHTIAVEFFSVVTSDSRMIEVQWKRRFDSDFEPFQEAFYTYQVCNDGIVDNNEKNPSSPFYCPSDVLNCQTADCSPASSNRTCGDGICQETPDSCFVDCSAQLTSVCRAIAKPVKTTDALDLDKDTIGTLIKNQYRFRVPGIEHMTYGVSILTGEEALAPLFYFSFCDDDMRTIQDLYRGSVYTVPDEVNVLVSPKCVYDTQFKNYSTSLSMANELATTAGIDTSANVGVSVFGIKSDVGFEYSEETSVREASAREKKNFGSVLSVELSCITSQVALTKHTFHPIFLADLSTVETMEDIIKRMKKYGTHYYKKAALGGRLKQITVVDQNFQSTKTENELSQQSQLQFSAGVSGLDIFSASFSASSSMSTESTFSQQSDYESKTSRSRIITYGGAPGSFGPVSNEAPSTFGDWAASVDLLPVPVQYELGRIDEIIPDTWKTKRGESIKSLWSTAYNYFKQNNTHRIDKQVTTKYSFYWITHGDMRGRYSEDVTFDITIGYNATQKIKTPMFQKAGVNGVNAIFCIPKDIFNTTSLANPYFDFIGVSLPNVTFLDITPSSGQFVTSSDQDTFFILQHDTRTSYQFQYSNNKWNLKPFLEEEYHAFLQLKARPWDKNWNDNFINQYQLHFDIRINGFYNSLSLPNELKFPDFFGDNSRIDYNVDNARPIVTVSGTIRSKSSNLGQILYAQIRAAPFSLDLGFEADVVHFMLVQQTSEKSTFYFGTASDPLKPTASIKPIAINFY